MLEVTLKISKETFVNDEGDSIDYYAYSADIMGESIKFYPKPEDKKLLKYFLDQAFKQKKA